MGGRVPSEQVRTGPYGRGPHVVAGFHNIMDIGHMGSPFLNEAENITFPQTTYPYGIYVQNPELIQTVCYAYVIAMFTSLLA